MSFAIAQFRPHRVSARFIAKPSFPVRSFTATQTRSTAPKVLQNFINGQFVDASSGTHQIPVTTPFTGKVIAHVPASSDEDVNDAVTAAKAAFRSWSSLTVKDRVQVLFRFYSLLSKKENFDGLTDLLVTEHGKNRTEAIGSIAKGIETLEYVLSLPQLVQGKTLEVARGVTCQDRREPLGVVAGIAPFNFPFMIPLWLLPFATATGNTFILKPSEKVPMTMNRVYELAQEAGFPDGVVNIVNGSADVAKALVDHPDVKAVAFVGSSNVAESIARRCNDLGKRVLALGGAKNHLVAAPDCNIEMTAHDVVNSFTGCSGQRCMAASVLLTIGKNPALIDKVVAGASTIKPGRENGCIGPVIDNLALDKILGYIDEAEESGAEILLDGRGWAKAHAQEGHWVGPTVILHKNKIDKAMKDEIFGPILSIYQCESPEEAIQIENSNPYGNAACIYTTTGATADWFTSRFSAGMAGVNIGVPVPREPFSFGGINRSRFGSHVDITGDGGIEFFTWRRKITTKWTRPAEQSWLH